LPKPNVNQKAMKKNSLIVTALLSSMLLAAQEPASGEDQVLKNKKGNEILPKKGDIALGFNTIPILDMFLGTLNRATPFSGSGNIVQYNSNTNNQITGKYFLDAKTAIRVRFGINTLSGSVTNQVQDAEALYKATLGTADDIAAASLLKVDDKLTFSKNNILLSVGYEKRRGYRRLQGFYGAELGIGNTGSRQAVTYGNAFSDQYAVEFTNNFNSLGVTTNIPTNPGRTTRTLESKNRGGIRVGLRGFVGIEYFIFAKISIAAEYGWGYAITTRRAAKSEREVYNNGQNGPSVFNETVEVDSKETLRGFAVDNNSGSIFSLNNTLGGNTALNGGAGSLTLLFHF
jgi:hypothetical protein